MKKLAANLDVTHFTAVDHTSDPSFYLRFLDEVNAIPEVVEWKPAMLNRPRRHLPTSNRLAERFQKMGGMTLELSKKIGFGGE